MALVLAGVDIGCDLLVIAAVADAFSIFRSMDLDEDEYDEYDEDEEYYEEYEEEDE